MHDEDLHLMQKLLSNLQSETDRGLALVGAAFLDERLKLVLAACFHGCEREIEQELLRYGSPLGEAKARLAACHALGLISDHEHKQTKLLFRIRNLFGHQVLAQSFDGTVADTAIPDLIAQLDPDIPEDVKPSRRAIVTFSVVEMWVRLWYRHEWVKKLRPKLPLWKVIEVEQARGQ